MDILSSVRPEKDEDGMDAFLPLIKVDDAAALDDTYALARLKALGLSNEEAAQLIKG